MTGKNARLIDGFEEPDEYRTSEPTVVVLNLILLAGLSEIFFPGVVPAFLSSFPFGAGDIVAFLTSKPSQVIGFTTFVVILVAVHELIHVVAHKLNGFDHSYGVTCVWFWKLPNLVPYVVVFDDPLTRSENIRGLLAPLVVLTVIGLAGLLPIFPEAVTYFAKVLLVVNTAGSSGDIYNSVKVAQYPSETLFLNVKSEGGIRTFTYEPDR